MRYCQNIRFSSLALLGGHSGVEQRAVRADGGPDATHQPPALGGGRLTAATEPHYPTTSAATGPQHSARAAAVTGPQHPTTAADLHTVPAPVPLPAPGWFIFRAF
jgi:hypothetical protein